MSDTPGGLSRSPESSAKGPVAQLSVLWQQGQEPDLKDFLEEVEKKAYELYQERIKSGVAGDDIYDWFQAEKEIKEKYKL